MSEQKNTKMKGGIILAICIVVIIILLGAVVYLLNARKAEDEPVKRNIVVNEKNVEDRTVGRRKNAARFLSGDNEHNMALFEWRHCF